MKHRARSILFFAFLLAMTGPGCRHTPTSERLLSADPLVRTREMTVLRDASDKTKLALAPVLIQALQNQDNAIVERASEALVVIGPSVVPSVVAVLNNPDIYVRISAAEILGKIGLPAQNAAPNLTLALKDPHPLVREEAAIALRKISQKTIPS